MILSNKAFIRAASTLRVKTVHIMQCIAFGQYGKSQGDRIFFSPTAKEISCASASLPKPLN
jgi:hypothetical protein